MTTIVSAPGKVLLTGGYLVLDQSFSGLVIGTSARFYTAISPSSDVGILVRSPQFKDASWSYTASVDVEDKLEFSAKPTDTRNPFVETCLRVSLAVILNEIGPAAFGTIIQGGLGVSIVGDNDFYSQRAKLQVPITAESLQSIDPFSRLDTSLKDVHKTGLGSSAAMTTSLVAALFLHFKAASLDTDHGRTLIHNVAQYVHCYAQGKVGSGFDVSAAIWGSHRYRRFNPDILKPIMDDNIGAEALYKALDPRSHSQCWDNGVEPFRLAPGMELMLADIDAGSHTPTLVGRVLAWRQSKPDEAGALWAELGRHNDQVELRIRHLEQLYKEDPSSYQSAFDTCANTKANEWQTDSNHPVIRQLAGLVAEFSLVRSLLRQMSKFSDVPIEPEEQTRLLDACMEKPGVVMAGVPGAGGYDAIFCIVLSEKAKIEVRQVWASWHELNVGPLLARADNSQGIVVVNLQSVPGLERGLLG